jgi:hypothetical protein
MEAILSPATNISPGRRTAPYELQLALNVHQFEHGTVLGIGASPVPVSHRANEVFSLEINRIDILQLDAVEEDPNLVVGISDSDLCHPEISYSEGSIPNRQTSTLRSIFISTGKDSGENFVAERELVSNQNDLSSDPSKVRPSRLSCKISASTSASGASPR